MMKFDITSGETAFNDPCLCSFGIIESIVAAIAVASTAVGTAATGVAVGAGVGAATAGAIGSVVGPALVYGAIGAGTGALSSAVTGGDPGMGALGGAITGGLGGGLAGAGVGAALGGALGVSPAIANAGLGAGIGALSAGITGGDPLAGALSGGVTGYAAGAMGSANGQDLVDSLYGVSGGPPAPPGLDAAGNPIPLNTAPISSADGVTQYASADAASAALGQGYPEAPAAGALNAQSALAAKTADKGTTSGIGKLLENPSVVLGALSALSSAMNKPQQGTYATPGPASNAANLGPLFNTPLNTNVPGRTAVNPNVPNWYTYGQIPGGATYFQGNSLKNFGFARGGALNSANSNEFMTDPYGSNHVRGPGGPVDDEVPALLSNGEYVLTSKEVKDISGNSNEQGARKLDRLRKTGALSRILRSEAA